MRPKQQVNHVGPETVVLDERLQKMCDVQKLLGGIKPNAKDGMQILDRLLRCMQSQNPSTQCDSFATLVIFLSVNTHIKIENVLETINKTLVSDGDNSRGERRIVWAAKIMCLGAIVRSKRVSSVRSEVLNDILGQFVSLGEKRTSLLITAASFICEVLSSATPKQKKKLDLTPLQTLLSNSSKPQKDSLFKISLTAYRLGYDLTSDFMESTETIVNTVLGFVKYEDKECLKLLFQYLLSVKLTKEFWKLFASKLGPYHFDLLHATIVSAIENGCPLKHIIRREVVVPFSLFRSSGDRESEKKVTTIFRLLLDWDPDKPNTAMKPKNRASAIKVFFGEAKLSFHQELQPMLRRFISFLTAEELDLVYEICQPLTSLESRGGNSTLTFLSRLPTLRNTGVETKLNIAKQLFHNAFCQSEQEALTEGEKPKVAPEILAVQKRVSREGFESVLKSTCNREFLKPLFSYVKSIATGKSDPALKKPVSEEDITNFKIITKLLKRMEDEDLHNILRIYGIYILVDSSLATRGLDTLIPLCEKTLSMDRQRRADEIVQFILSAISEEKVIFDYKALFGKLLMEQVVSENSLQQLVQVIDVEMDQLEAEDDEDEDEEDTDGDSGSEISEILAERSQSNGFHSSANKRDSEEEDQNTDEESINMDDASDTELEKMDAAIANVFSTKKRMKTERKLEDNYTIRALNMIGMLLRRYRTTADGAIALMLINPCLNLLRKSSKSKKSGIQDRVMFVVRQLNKLKKITNAENFDKSLIENVVTDIDGILGKKLQKNTRVLVQGTLGMVQRCFAHQLQPALNGKGGTKAEKRKRKEITSSAPTEKGASKKLRRE